MVYSYFPPDVRKHFSKANANCDAKCITPTKSESYRNICNKCFLSVSFFSAYCSALLWKLGFEPRTFLLGVEDVHNYYYYYYYHDTLSRTLHLSILSEGLYGDLWAPALPERGGSYLGASSSCGRPRPW